MRFNKWTLGLAAVGAASLAAVNRKQEEDALLTLLEAEAKKINVVLVDLSQTDTMSIEERKVLRERINAGKGVVLVDNGKAVEAKDMATALPRLADLLSKSVILDDMNPLERLKAMQGENLVTFGKILEDFAAKQLTPAAAVFEKSSKPFKNPPRKIFPGNTRRNSSGFGISR